MLYDRPTVATSDYFKGKTVKVDDVPTLIDSKTADAIEFYLIQNGYVDMDRKVTDKYRNDLAAGALAALPADIAPMTEDVHKLVQAVFDESILKDMFTDGHETKVKDNPLNDNFYKKEFQTLWNYINHKYAYTVEFDSEELIKKAIAHIDDKLIVSQLQYTTSIGQQKSEMNEHEVERGDSFKTAKTRTQTLQHAETSRVKYDLIGKVAEGTTLTVTDDNGKEEVIEFPEAMTFELDSLLNLYMSKNYLGEDNDCRMKDINPIFEKEVYIDRLKRIPSIIEMPYNEVVQKFIDRYSGRLRHSVSYMLGASNFYMPIFEEALETYGLPLELKYLPVIESALNPTAVSRVGATGLWQFMLATGKRYGLEVNTLVDERRDPIKASYAAANYLSDLYKVFGDWNLVIAAYNCGPDQINKAIHRSKGSKDYWQIYPYLPKETRGYVPAFIAANYIMTYYCEHNICPMTTRLPAKTDTVMVSRNVHLEQIAAVCNIDIEQLRTLNPAYRRDIVPGATKMSAVRLPHTEVGKFIDLEDSIYAYNAEVLFSKRATVEVNDDVPTYTRKSSTKRSRKKASRSRGRSVTVKSGQTLSEIAKRNGTTVAKLRRLNGIKGSNIRAGKKLRVR